MAEKWIVDLTVLQLYCNVSYSLVVVTLLINKPWTTFLSEPLKIENSNSWAVMWKRFFMRYLIYDTRLFEMEVVWSKYPLFAILISFYNPMIQYLLIFFIFCSKNIFIAFITYTCTIYKILKKLSCFTIFCFFLFSENIYFIRFFLKWNSVLFVCLIKKTPKISVIILKSVFFLLIFTYKKYITISFHLLLYSF